MAAAAALSNSSSTRCAAFNPRSSASSSSSYPSKTPCRRQWRQRQNLSGTVSLISRRVSSKVLASKTPLREPLLQDGPVTAELNHVEREPTIEVLNNAMQLPASSQEMIEGIEFDSREDDSTVTITVLGASGDLAKKKIFPALFALYYEDCLPKHFTICGYAQ